MIPIKKLRRMLSKSNVNLVVFDHDVPLCMPTTRTIYIPATYLEEGLDDLALKTTMLSVVHEVQHILRTTFDVSRLVKTKQERHVFNTLEDLRIDRPLIKQYGLKDVYEYTYIDPLKGKSFKKRTPWYVQVTYVLLLEMLGYSTDDHKDIQEFIHDKYLKEHAQNIIDMLNKLEKNPTDEAYDTAKVYITWMVKRMRRTS